MTANERMKLLETRIKAQLLAEHVTSSRPTPPSAFQRGYQTSKTWLSGLEDAVRGDSGKK